MLFEKIQLEPGEDVLKIARKHWFIIAVELLGVLFMLLMPFLIWIAISMSPSELFFSDLNLGDYTSLIIFSISLWSIFTLMVGFATWTHYYLDHWIITDRRIILIDQVRFFNRNVSIFRLERLQDIEFSIKGIIPTLLNFGTIQAQTAGAFESNFKTKGMPDPRGLQATIQKAMDKRLAILHYNPDLTE